MAKRQLINMLRDERQLREMPPFEFENWAVVALGGIPNRVKVGDYGIDGKLYPVERAKGKGDGQGFLGDIDPYYRNPPPEAALYGDRVMAMMRA